MLGMLNFVIVCCCVFDMSFFMFVIGGGSGGISAARHASELGKKVALADFVRSDTPWACPGEWLHSKFSGLLCLLFLFKPLAYVLVSALILVLFFCRN